MRKALRICILALAVFGSAAASGITSPPATHIVIAHTNDIHGQLLPKNGLGGIAEIATIIRGIGPDLTLDAGDLFTGTFLSDEYKGAPIIEAMNKIGYTSGTIGNHEFDYGQDALRMRLREAKFPVLSANLQTPVSQIRKYTVVKVKGIRFGIIGVTTEDVGTTTHPRNLAGVAVHQVVTALRQLLPEVRNKSDFIILTAHINDDEERLVANTFPEIRLIIGGHNHDALGPMWLGSTLVAKTGSSGRNVGRVDLDFDGRKLTRIEARLIPVKDAPGAPDIAKVLEPFQVRVAARMAEIVGEATAQIARSKDFESPLGDLVADAFREKGKTEIALHNIGGIRAAIAKGPITWGSVFEVLPFQNTLVTLKLTGAQLKNTLNVTMAGIPAISGIRVRYDLERRVGEQLLSISLADGTPIDESRLYSITTNDFVLAGGDGFTDIGRGREIIDTGISLREVFVEYIKARRILSPTLDGRVGVN